MNYLVGMMIGDTATGILAGLPLSNTTLVCGSTKYPQFKHRSSARGTKVSESEKACRPSNSLDKASLHRGQRNWRYNVSKALASGDSTSSCPSISFQAISGSKAVKTLTRER